MCVCRVIVIIIIDVIAFIIIVSIKIVVIVIIIIIIIIMIIVIESPNVGWLFFSSFPPPSQPRRHLRRCKKMLFTTKPFVLSVRYLGQRKYRYRKMDRITFPWCWQRSWLFYWLTAICFSALWSRNHSTNHYKICWIYPSSHSHYVIGFWSNSVGNRFCGDFFGFFSRSKTILLATSQDWLIWLMWNKKEVHRLDTASIMRPLPLPIAGPWFFKINVWNQRKK